MHLFTRNVNTAFRDLVGIFASGGQSPRHSTHDVYVRRSPSRNGQVMVIDEPVTVTYTHPRERVLFNAARDANPFFHLYESLWMLAGRNDVAPLAYYAKGVARYSDDGKTFNGAYGYRWRTAKAHQPAYYDTTVDQLDILVNHLKADPHSRRAVLQMWNVEDDLLKIGQKGGCDKCRPSPSDRMVGIIHNWIPCPNCTASKDVCCNLSVMFSVRDGPYHAKVGEEDNGCRYLDMTVTNRSNDAVWGMLGANYVHFSFLQEYMAARIGCEVGRYNQFTNNLHIYDEPDSDNVPKWRPDEWLASNGDLTESYKMVPLVRDPAVFDEEMKQFVDQGWGGRHIKPHWKEPFLNDVAFPAVLAFAAHKRGETDKGLDWCRDIKADDWKIACTNWLERRRK